MKKFLNYNFLMTVLASVVVLLEVLMNVFNVNLHTEAVISVSVAIIGLMVTLGIVDKGKNDKEVKTKEDLKNFINNDNEETISQNKETKENSEKVAEKLNEKVVDAKTNDVATNEEKK